MPRGNNTYKMNLEVGRKEITELHLQGYSQHAIAAKVGRTQGSISKSLKAMRETLHKESIQNMGEARAIQEARLESILKEYWVMYNGDSVEHPEQAMAGALRTVTELSKLLGLNIPTTQIIDQTVTLSNEAPNPDALAAKLASVFGTSDVIDGELVTAPVLPAPSDATETAADDPEPDLCNDEDTAPSDATEPPADPPGIDPESLAQRLAEKYGTDETPAPPVPGAPPAASSSRPTGIASNTSRSAIRRLNAQHRAAQ